MKHSVTVDATNNLGDEIEHADFQVAVNGKTFKVLLDDLYSNKIRGVLREPASNAIDAQIEAGNGDQPFDIYLPTTMYPEFRIRDYGTGLSHADMMTLYVKLFESTKDGNDDVTGAFGLGSKIPFAYTDSFQVTSYFNGERRVYTANMGSDGTPGIHHIKELRGPTEEPNGLEVSFAVRVEDFSSFRDELSHLVLAFPTMPNVIGDDFQPVTPEWTSEDGSVFAIERRFYGTQFAIKQGCAIYPVDGYYAWATHLDDDYSWTLVIDVPIGSVDIAPDREKLQMNDRTKEAVKKAIGDAGWKLSLEISKGLNDAANRREVRRLYTGFTKYALKGFKDIDLSRHSAPGKKWKPSNVVEIEGGSDWEPPKFRAGTKRAVDTMDSVQLDIIPDAFFVVFDSTKPVTRQTLRYSAFVELMNGAKKKVFRLDDPTPRQIERLYTLLELRPGQIVSVASLEDPGPPVRKPKPKRVSGVREHVLEARYHSRRGPVEEIKELPDNYYWYQLNRWADRDSRYRMDRQIETYRELGLLDETTPILVFTKSAVERIRPSERTELTNVIDRLKDDAQEQKFLEMVSGRLTDYMGNLQVWEHLGYEVIPLQERKLSGLSATSETMARVTKEVDAIMQPLREAYPAVFRSDPQFEDIAWYIDARDAEKELNS